MKKIIVAPVGEYIEDIYVSIREFPTEKVILITPKQNRKLAEKTKNNLDRFKVPTKIIEVHGNIWEEIFKEVAKIKETEGKEVMINVSTGDRDSRCAATSAAFVNGLKAFAVDGNETMMLPILKFSYYSMLEGRKMKILKTLDECKDTCTNLEILSRRTKMSLPLLSYHINGNLKSEGLKKMGLVETEESKGHVKAKLSFLGNMLLKGYIK